MTRLIGCSMIVALAVGLGGCASGYSTFYTPVEDATREAVAALRAAPAPSTPKLERATRGDDEAMMARYAKRGYVMIGQSMFNAGSNQSEAAAVKQGQAVGADLVLVFHPEYTGSVTTAMPLTTPTTTTSYTTGSATAYGSGGATRAYGTATTTTYGSNTTYVPITVNRSDYGAIYFVKQRFNFGAFVRDLNDSEKRQLQTNRGVVILTVVDDSPAFESDVIPGDIIAAIDGVAVKNEGAFSEMMSERRGKAIELEMFRDGQKLRKTVQLND